MGADQADNTTALAFYKKRLFFELAVADVPFHPRLHHVGGSILMRKNIDLRD